MLHHEVFAHTLPSFTHSHHINYYYLLLHVSPTNQQDSFADPADKGNKEYLVACAFSHIHMQQNGELNLFGIASSNPFFRQFMEKMGSKCMSLSMESTTVS
jgi:hypothetical protein